jgi:ABC-type branched-subunit amino acid transport system substrate-binding protein
MSNKNFLITAVVIIVIAILSGLYLSQKPNLATVKTPIKIGVITDLTGPASYWGISTQAGINLAKEDLAKEGYLADIITEDYKLEPNQGLNAAQKLSNIDNVDAFYVEFNPGTYTISPFLKDKNKLMIYDAAPTTPLKDSPNFFKTYLDYQVGCKQMAQNFKNDGMIKVASLQPKLEFGELCTKGVQEVFPNAMVETYNMGEDVKNQITKIDQAGNQGVVSVGFENNIIGVLKSIKDINSKLKVGVTGDAITDKVKDNYSDQLKGYSFGFGKIDPSFVSRIKSINPNITSPEAASLGYLHTTQLVKSLTNCNKELVCAKNKISQSQPNSIIAFKGFADQKANIEQSVDKLDK